MLVLGIDSSAKTAACGICDDEKTIVNFTLDHKRTHSEKLLEMIDMALKIAKLSLNDIDAYAVTKGPGSFTGLRIGLSTIKGLCHVLNKPCYMCSTIDALYMNVKNSYNDDFLIVPIMDARRNEVYTGAYFKGEKVIQDKAIKIEDLFKETDKLSFEKILFTGDGIEPNREIIINKYKERAYFTERDKSYIDGSAVIKAALKEKSVSYNDILPTYLRKSQAERLKEERK